MNGTENRSDSLKSELIKFRQLKAKYNPGETLIAQENQQSDMDFGPSRVTDAYTQSNSSSKSEYYALQRDSDRQLVMQKVEMSNYNMSSDSYKQGPTLRTPTTTKNLTSKFTAVEYSDSKKSSRQTTPMKRSDSYNTLAKSLTAWNNNTATQDNDSDSNSTCGFPTNNILKERNGNIIPQSINVSVKDNSRLLKTADSRRTSSSMLRTSETSTRNSINSRTGTNPHIIQTPSNKKHRIQTSENLTPTRQSNSKKDSEKSLKALVTKPGAFTRNFDISTSGKKPQPKAKINNENLYTNHAQEPDNGSQLHKHKRKVSMSSTLSTMPKVLDQLKGTGKLIDESGISQQIKDNQELSPRRTITELQAEVEKWKKFGKMMTDSYEQLNTRFTTFLKGAEEEKAANLILKDQVARLTVQLEACEEENEDLRLSNSDSKTAPKSYEMEEEIAKLKEQIDFLRAENLSISNTLKETEHAESNESYYKKMANQKIQECSELAEEIICLRTDLDRSHSDFLKLQREVGSAAKYDLFNQGKKPLSRISSQCDDLGLGINRECTLGMRDNKYVIDVPAKSLDDSYQLDGDRTPYLRSQNDFF